MIAKIIEKDKREYYSMIFAVCYNGWNTAVIVFDDEKNKFSFVTMFGYTKGLTRSVFIIDCDKQDFVKNKVVKINAFKKIKNISGYAWLVENPELFVDIIKNKKINEEYKKKAIQLNANIALKEWTLVENERDVENLLSVSGGFHDGIIEKVVFNNELDTLEVVFSGCWNSKITLSFHSDPAIKISCDDQFISYIMSSNIFFENGFVYWVDDASISNLQQLNENKDLQYFRARALSWKQETEYND